MIIFDVLDVEAGGEKVMLNCHELKQFVTCDYEGKLCLFTSVGRARYWAEEIVFQRYSGLPPKGDGHVNREGGWRDSQELDL